MELTLIIASFVAGYWVCSHLVARRRKCSTAHVVRETLTIQRGDPGEER